tara:strand:+ start:772 stop:963 length:192 start_codon:yes stop_codon:yes gene_type:complete
MIDVIPDREVMVQAVDTIVALEEMLKRGERLTPAQKKQVARARVVARDITKLKRTTDNTVTFQ